MPVLNHENCVRLYRPWLPFGNKFYNDTNGYHRHDQDILDSDSDSRKP